MKLMLDTNVILDFLLCRQNYEPSVKLLQMASEDGMIECVTASSVTDIYYILNKNIKDSKITKERLISLLKIISVLEVDNNDINSALSSDWDDFEDAVQFYVALHHNVDVIITGNKKDFTLSSIPVYTAEEFVTEFALS